MTYEYVCTACAHEWEAEQRISEAPLTDCPACGAATARRQISAGAGFILKGSGWYADGYSSSKSEKKPEAKSEAKPSTTTETKAVTKPATTTTNPSSADKPKTPSPDKGQHAA